MCLRERRHKIPVEPGQSLRAALGAVKGPNEVAVVRHIAPCEGGSVTGQVRAETVFGDELIEVDPTKIANRLMPTVEQHRHHQDVVLSEDRESGLEIAQESRRIPPVSVVIQPPPRHVPAGEVLLATSDFLAASAFDLQNAQTNAANAAIDRTRALGIQKKGDDFEANLGRILGAGTPEGELMELEKVHQASGVKGAFARDPKTGGLAKSADGKFQWVNEGGSTENVTLEDSIGRYIAKVDPKGEFTRKRTQQDELAKEEREAKRSDAIAKRDHKYAVNRLYVADSITDGNEKPEKETPLSASDLKSLFGEDYEIGKDANGLPKMGNRIDRQLQNKFLAWASVNKRKATMSAYQDWVANGNQGQPQPKQDKNSGNVVTWLKSRNISDEISAAEAIKELRAKKWTDEQINAAFDELGL